MELCLEKINLSIDIIVFLMKKNVFFWRYLTLALMLFGAVSASYAGTNEIAGTNTSNSQLAPPVARIVELAVNALTAFAFISKT